MMAIKDSLTYLLTIDEEYTEWEMELTQLQWKNEEIRRSIPKKVGRYHLNEQSPYWKEIRHNNIKQINLKKLMKERVAQYRND